MNRAIIRLESFSTDHARAAQFSRQAMREAYEEGYAEGRASEAQSDLKRLALEMHGLAGSLEREDVRRAEIRNEAVKSLLPILSQILDEMSTQPRSARLEARLTEELARLAGMSAAVRCRVRCGAGLRRSVEDCISAAGIKGIDIEETDTEGVSLLFSGGRIEFDKAKVAKEIRNLIAEITENDE